MAMSGLTPRRSTRKALEDAEFWDLPLEEALRSLKTRPLRSKALDPRA